MDNLQFVKTLESYTEFVNDKSLYKLGGLMESYDINTEEELEEALSDLCAEEIAIMDELGVFEAIDKEKIKSKVKSSALKAASKVEKAVGSKEAERGFKMAAAKEEGKQQLKDAKKALDTAGANIKKLTGNAVEKLKDWGTDVAAKATSNPIGTAAVAAGVIAAAVIARKIYKWQKKKADLKAKDGDKDQIKKADEMIAKEKANGKEKIAQAKEKAKEAVKEDPKKAVGLAKKAQAIAKKAE